MAAIIIICRLYVCICKYDDGRMRFSKAPFGEKLSVKVSNIMINFIIRRPQPTPSSSPKRFPDSQLSSLSDRKTPRHA